MPAYDGKEPKYPALIRSKECLFLFADRNKHASFHRKEEEGWDNPELPTRWVTSVAAGEAPDFPEAFRLVCFSLGVEVYDIYNGLMSGK